jgi:hypothetical protein
MHQEQIYEFRIPEFPYTTVTIEPTKSATKNNRVPQEKKRIIKKKLASSADRNNPPPLAVRKAFGKRRFSASR